MIWDLPSQILGLKKALGIFSLENIIWSWRQIIQKIFSWLLSTSCRLKFFTTNYSLFKGKTMEMGYFNFLSISNASIHCYFTHSFSMHGSPAILSHPSTSSSLHARYLHYNPHSRGIIISSFSSSSCQQHVLIFSEINKTIICPNISFFQLHLLFWASIYLYFSHYYSKCEFHKYLKWLPLSRLCWHVRCDPSLGVYNLVTRKGKKPTFTDNLLSVSVPAQHLMHLYTLWYLYTQWRWVIPLLFKWGGFESRRG